MTAPDLASTAATLPTSTPRWRGVRPRTRRWCRVPLQEPGRQSSVLSVLAPREHLAGAQTYEYQCTRASLSDREIDCCNPFFFLFRAVEQLPKSTLSS